MWKIELYKKDTCFLIHKNFSFVIYAVRTLFLEDDKKTCQKKKKWGRKKSKKIVVVQEEKETKQENVENNWCIFEIKTMLENKKK